MHSRNIQHPIDGGESFWSRRHGHEFSGHLVPFGAEIIFKPPKAKDPHLKFEPVGSRGVFLGYALNPGGRFDGDYLCAKLEDFADMQNVRVFQVKGINPVMPFVFPLRTAANEAMQLRLREREVNTIENDEPGPQPVEDEEYDVREMDDDDAETSSRSPRWLRRGSRRPGADPDSGGATYAHSRGAQSAAGAREPRRAPD